MTKYDYCHHCQSWGAGPPGNPGEKHLCSPCRAIVKGTGTPYENRFGLTADANLESKINHRLGRERGHR